MVLLISVVLLLKFLQMKDRGGFRVLLDTYVTEESGTGVVHQAPYFGEVFSFVLLFQRVLHSTNMKFWLKLTLFWVLGIVTGCVQFMQLTD